MIECLYCGGECGKDNSVQYRGYICKECGKYRDMDMEIYDEPTCTEMPKYCNIWPCSGNEESKLEPDENGFMWCIECGRCYGKK